MNTDETQIEMKNLLSIQEKADLNKLEKVVDGGKKTFVEVGLALSEIRERRLYRLDFNNFEDYCQTRWGWTRQNANRLIEASVVIQSLPKNLETLVSNLDAAKQIAKLPEADRAGVVKSIVASGKVVTSAEVKKHLPPPPVRPVADRVDSTDSPSVAAPLPPPPPSQVLDGTNWPIPTQLIPLWQRADEVQELLTILSRVKGVLRSAQDKGDMLFAEVCFSSALSQLDQAWTDIKTAKPFAVCPVCQGQVPDQCTLCKGRGMLSEHRWNTCVPREDKMFRAKRKAAGNLPDGNSPKA